MSLRDVFDEVAAVRKSHEWLLPMLMEGLGSSREVDPPGPKSWLSVSRVPTMCPRALVMVSRLGLPMVDNIEPQNRWAMDRGTAIHTVFQDLWLGPLKWVRGGWTCSRCAHLHGGVGQDRWSVRLENAVFLPDQCEKCGQKWNKFEPFGFVEPYSVHEDIRVRGRNDGFLCLPGCGIEVMDLKTTSRLDLVRVKPKQEHVEQVQWYLDAEKLRRGRIVYMDPGAKRIEESIVEHKVAFDPELMHKQKERVRVLRKALEEESRPVPACPYGGKSSFGDCDCVEVAVLWARTRR